MLEWMMKNVCNWLNECMFEWMYERKIKKLGKIEVSVSSGFLHRLGVS